jgi:predicted metal-dependent peptidase
MDYQNEIIPYSFTEARTALSVNAVFFAVIMYRETQLIVIDRDVDPKSSRFVPTACTDSKRIYINQAFFEDELGKAGRVFVMAHEIYHVMCRHAQKWQVYARAGLFGRPFYPKLMQWCADAVINASLIESGIGSPPEMIVLHPGIGGNELIETVYERFLKQIPEEFDTCQSGSMGMSGEGDEEGDCSGSDEDGDDGDDDIGGGSSAEDMGFGGKQTDTVIDPADGAAGEQQMRNAIAAATTSQKMAGKMPGGLLSFIDEVLDPQIDWRQELRDFFVVSLGKDQSSWKRPNRRKMIIPGVYYPKKMGLRCGPVVLGFDTSGSMSDLDIATILAEVCGILTDVTPESCHVVWCDARVERVDEVENSAELLELARTEGAPGRGGTRFDPVFEWVEDNLEDPPAVMVYGTDGHPSEWPPETICDYPVIWLMTTDIVAPWGTTLRVMSG